MNAPCLGFTCAALVLAVADAAWAQDTSSVSLPPPEPEVRRHVVYLEAFGPGRLYSVNYEHRRNNLSFRVGATAFQTDIIGRIERYGPIVGAYRGGAGRDHWLLGLAVSVQHFKEEVCFFGCPEGYESGELAEGVDLILAPTAGVHRVVWKHLYVRASFTPMLHLSPGPHQVDFISWLASSLGIAF